MTAPRAPLADEHRVFVDLIGEILDDTPGLAYQLHIGEAEDEKAPYAVFDIATNPAHELTVVIELAPREFRVRVNGNAYPVPLENPKRIERWIERRCRDVTRLVEGDLRIDEEMLGGRYLSSDLLAGRKDSWTALAEHDDGWGWIGLLGLILPFGPSPFRTRKIEYADWFRSS